MLSLRRPQHEARVEIMPLIDVIFLLRRASTACRGVLAHML